MTLEGAGARDLVYLDLGIFGNGGAFDVTVELHTDCPSDGLIPGPSFTWNAVPDDGCVWTLGVDPLSPAERSPTRSG